MKTKTRPVRALLVSAQIAALVVLSTSISDAATKKPTTKKVCRTVKGKKVCKTVKIAVTTKKPATADSAPPTSPKVPDSAPKVADSAPPTTAKAAAPKDSKPA